MIDAVLYRQFGRYLEEKNKVVWLMTTNDLIQEIKNFLTDKYPGAKKPPHQLILMLASPGIHPDAKLESISILNYDDVNACLSPFDENISIPFISLYGSTCPEGFLPTEFNRYCIHESQKMMSFKDAQMYCEEISNGTGHLLDLEDKTLSVDINSFISRFISRLVLRFVLVLRFALVLRFIILALRFIILALRFIILALRHLVRFPRF